MALPVTAGVDDAVGQSTRFARMLRDEGVFVSTAQIVDFCDAAAKLPPEDFYWAGMATLVSDRDEVAIYDRIFQTFFTGHVFDTDTAADQPPTMPSPPSIGMGGPAADDEDSTQQAALASSIEILQQKSFAELTEEQLHELFSFGRRLEVPQRRSRRYRPARRGAADLRRTMRASFRTGNEPVNRAWRARTTRPRRVIMLLDVSGSMTAYSRALLYFAHAGIRTNRRWEAFCFATRLTRVTPALLTGKPDAALAAAADGVADWDGGTRIGASIKKFLDEYGHGGLARGACVVICSDGLEIEEPELLGQQMFRLSLLAHRIVWFNPLKEDPAYQPLVRGIRAALPYIDVFESAHNYASLAEGMRQTLHDASFERLRRA